MAPIEHTAGGTVITGPEIKLARARALLGALKLEMYGMTRSSSPSAYIIIKRDFNFKGDRQRVYTQLEDWLRKRGWKFENSADARRS